MGGDGGVVATNRRYMRGAGSADHTADSSRASALDVAEAERERLQQTMRMCAITGIPFDFTPPSDARVVVGGAHNSGSGGSPPQVGGIVACPYGRLYTREAALQALVRRGQQQHASRPQGGGEGECTTTTTPEIGWHVRGLKDLHPVRFHVVYQSSGDAVSGKRGGGSDDRVFLPACPITGIDLNGLHPTYVITHKKKKKKKSKKGGKERDSQEDIEGPNVLCEKAFKEMGDSLQEEYGPFQKEDLIRLAPPAGRTFDEIRDELTLRRDRESSKTTKKKRKTKPSDGARNGEVRPERVKAITEAPTSKKPRSSVSNSAIGRRSAVDVMRKNVAAAVASSAALSSLFVDKRPHLSEGEKKNNLFVR